MSLPDGGVWPPQCQQRVDDKLSEWSAWFSGDPKELEAAYNAGAGDYGRSSTARRFFEADKPRGGISGMLQRMWWGRQVPEGEQRAKLHVPLAGSIAAVSADQLFAEPPALKGGNDATTQRLAEYEKDGLWTWLRESAEVDAGLGGVFLRVVWDADISDRPWIDCVHPDAAVPEWRFGRLAAVTFWRCLHSDKGKTIRHLERHSPGLIEHGVWEGDDTKLGVRRSLMDYEETEPIGRALTDQDIIDTRIKQLTAVYVPNMRPNRLWRTDPHGCHMGRADYAGVEPAMDALDETWSSTMRDLRLGKGRITVPESALESYGRGKGARWDDEREVYTGLELAPDGGGGITVSQFAIRSKEHLEICEALMEVIVSSAGYSPSTFGLAGTAAKTATEVDDRARATEITRGRKVAYWDAGITDILRAQLAIDTEWFNTPGLVADGLEVDFPRRVFIDPLKSAEAVQMLRAAQAASTETLVRMANPRWSDEQVADELARMGVESAAQDRAMLAGYGV